MNEDYKVLEIALNTKQINQWIERLRNLSEKEHVHLEHDKGEILVKQK